MQDNELITRLKSGDERAFEQLVAQYQDRIYNTVLGFIQNEIDAEDLTQDVFVRVFQRISEFKGESKLSTWIYRIAINIALDRVKKLKAQKRGGFLKSLFGKEMDEDVQDFYHPGVALEQKENAALLFQVIKELPGNQQTAFLLQKLEGLSQQEIADIMKTTVSAVESLLMRAKTNLKQQLTQKFKHLP